MAAENGYSSYGISQEQLNDVNESKEALAKHNGVIGIAEALRSNLSTGLDVSIAEGDLSLEGRKHVFGANVFKEVPLKSFFRLLFDNLKDPILILLMLAALVSTVLGVAIPEERADNAWTEGVAIWVAVIVVSGVGAVNDYQKDMQFKKLNEQKDVVEVKVQRGGHLLLVLNSEVVVGDVVILDTGDKIIADGLAFEENNLVVDEASLTGESEPVKKTEEDCWCRSGTRVTEGSGKMLVIAVGVNSEWGKTMAMVVGETSDTPLQEKLTYLATAIGKVGIFVAVVCFCVLTVRWCIEEAGFPLNKISEGPLQFFIFGVTIVVVAVPEGLPLAVTISLAYSMKKMMKDNNFVRVLAACETMGGATAICSDKTGTLTENRMTVVDGSFGGKLSNGVPDAEQLPEPIKKHMTMNCCLNSKAFLIENDAGEVEFVGNRTECALLMLVRGWGLNYEEIRKKHEPEVLKLYGFSSLKKTASILIKTEDGIVYYSKGAAEIVLKHCTHYLDETGSKKALEPAMQKSLEDTITQLASTGLRTICLAYTPLEASQAPTNYDEPPDVPMTMVGIVGIKDPVRKEVPEAVATCKRAGIFVRMVTGDNVHTAKHIAAECGIYSEGGLALEGPDFRKMSEEELIPLLPRLQVLARSSPADKYTLVKLLKKTGEVVAVTGDGTNDAPALKEADVGLAMGIAGTEVAKEAADIVILDDNFNSIVKSVLWGRSVFNNIRKFLQFQITINFVALVVAFVAAVTSGETPLNVMQLLWVNLIMDSLAALALATEPPTPQLLDLKPYGRTEPLINRRMWRHIITQGLYQLFWLFLIIYGAPSQLPHFSLPNACSAYSTVNTVGFSPKALTNVMNPEDLCCLKNDTSGVTGYPPCFTSQGGLYLATEQPVCVVRPDLLMCDIYRPVDDPSGICGKGQGSNCDRYADFNWLDDKANKQYKKDVEKGKEKYNSVVFNTFIWMQIFNEINARMVQDELNVFKGFFRNSVFISVFVITVGCQIILMETPVSTFFLVESQSWQEWLFALAVGLGALPLALLTKLAARVYYRGKEVV